jgi:hypothetical protein
MASSVVLYLDLLKKSILEELYVENELRLIYLRECIKEEMPVQQDVFLHIRERRPDVYREYVELRDIGINYGRTINNLGFQHTMIGRRRLENIQTCMETILADGVSGDLIECGVWRGGAVIFMKGFLAAHQVGDRTVWVADSFMGLPMPTLEQDEGLDLSLAKFPMLAIDMETVVDLFVRYGLMDSNVRFLKGWFKDTLQCSPVRELSLLRVDGDLYESTWDALDSLYGRVTPGGFIIVDDYGALPQCRQAVLDYREQQKIRDPIQTIDWTGVFWRKEHS